MCKFGQCNLFAILAATISLSLLAPTHAQEMVVGVNVVNPMRASVADQNALLAQIKAAHLSIIRCGISNDDKGIDFAKRAFAEGIRLQLIVGPQYAPNAPMRPYQPNEFPAMGAAPRSHLQILRFPSRHFSVCSTAWMPMALSSQASNSVTRSIGRPSIRSSRCPERERF